MTEKIFIVDAEKCTSCKMCVVACKDEHVDAAYEPWSRPQPVTGQFWVDIIAKERGRLPRVRMTYLPMFCQHCADAPCITACPEDAIETRPDGLVWIDSKACTGCGACEPACPYDVIFMNEAANIAQKCTGCAHRVDRGELPRCAEVCPHEAIMYGEPNMKGDPAIAVPGPERPLVQLHPEYNANPRVLWRGLPKPWISGCVIDKASDEVVIGAAVTATDQAGGGTVSLNTDAFGDFWLKGLETGRDYRVDIAMPGYTSFTRTVTTDDDCDLGTIELLKGP